MRPKPPGQMNQPPLLLYPTPMHADWVKTNRASGIAFRTLWSLVSGDYNSARIVSDNSR